MTSSDLWSENALLRRRLQELQQEFGREREERLTLQAELLWIKHLARNGGLPIPSDPKGLRRAPKAFPPRPEAALQSVLAESERGRVRY